MTTEQGITREEAIDHLASSERGREALRRLLAWLDDGGIGLDAVNQTAVLMVLVSAWRKPGSTRDLMRDALDGAAAEI